jgi:hypothetical protein
MMGHQEFPGGYSIAADLDKDSALDQILGW